MKDNKHIRHYKHQIITYNRRLKEGQCTLTFYAAANQERAFCLVCLKIRTQARTVVEVRIGEEKENKI